MNRTVLAAGVVLAVAGLAVMAWFTFGPGGAGGPGGPGGDPAVTVPPPPVSYEEIGPIQELDDAGFDAAVAKGVVLVECYAPAFPLSVRQLPVTGRLARRYAGRVLVARLDAEQHRQTTLKLKLQYLPMLVVFRDGQQAASFIGIQTEDKLAAELDRVLAEG